ncbi:hypothetical protein RUM43_004505 [Polyplax serrata]|uniref:Uncharacterized protein n=1 Tax=Polyplax serrata TaxID=468196 RepID=A0AAN8XPZ7_POLSC
MWNDVDDLVKDLVQLNTFGTPIDEKSYHMFYMNDNYPKPKNKGETKKKNVESFLDPRTGEEISVVPDVTYETTGYRDNSDMKTLWADLELQNQLKLVGH